MIAGRFLDMAGNFLRLWRDEGAGMALRILKAKAQWAWLRSRRPHQLLKRHIAALDRPMYLDLEDRGLSKTLFYRGIHEPLPTQWVREEVEPGMTVLDIGANIGYYVMLEAQLVGDRGRVYAIEPVPETMQICRKNIRLNTLSNVTTHEIAMGGQGGKATMNITPYRNWSFISHETLNSDQAVSMKRLAFAEIPVKTMALDEFIDRLPIKHVHFIRMDVEGYEVEIIRNGIGVLINNRPLKILMELHPFLASSSSTFEDLVTTLYRTGLRIKYLAHDRSLIAQWPSLDETIQFLRGTKLAISPHALFSTEA
jgi:FkbM family methyltransferase